MSNIFIKNKSSDIFKNVSSSDSLTGFMSQKDKSDDLTSSDSLKSFMHQNGGSFDLVSSDNTSSFMPQKDDSYSTTSDSGGIFMHQKGSSFDLVSSETQTSLMPQKGGTRNLNYSDNTSSFMPQKSGSYSTTSDSVAIRKHQKGGTFNSSIVKKNTDDQVNQLISMLTTESENSQDFSTNSTSTAELENKLRNMLQDGGNSKQSSVSFKTPTTNFNSLKNDLKNQSKYYKGYNITNDESTEELRKRMSNILSETTTEYKK